MEEEERRGSSDGNMTTEAIIAEISNRNMTNAANLVDLELIMDGTVTEDNIVDHLTGLLTSENVGESIVPLKITCDKIKEGLIPIATKLWSNLTVTLESTSGNRNRRHSLDFKPKNMSTVEKRGRGSSNDDQQNGTKASKMSTSLNSNTEVFTSPKISDNPNSTPTQDVEENIQEKDYVNKESPNLRPITSEISPKGEIPKPKKEVDKNPTSKTKNKEFTDADIERQRMLLNDMKK